MIKDNILNIVKYILTIPLIAISIVLIVWIFHVIYPYILFLILFFKDNINTWLLFGKWGLLTLSVIVSLPVVFIYSIVVAYLHGLVCRISPKKNLSIYTSLILSIFYFSFSIYFVISGEANSTFSIVKIIIGEIYLAAILGAINLALIYDGNSSQKS